ncbi:MAG: radical SAM protein [Candidatus Baldrarchaeia archaeon]
MSELLRKFMEIYEKTPGYVVVGKYRHSAVKPCHWFEQKLFTGIRHCYKEKFYGIKSHQCLQNSPMIFCNHRCIYCWRIHPSDVGLSIKETALEELNLDDPRTIVSKMIEAQKQIVQKKYPLERLLQHYENIVAVFKTLFREKQLSLNGLVSKTKISKRKIKGALRHLLREEYVVETAEEKYTISRNAKNDIRSAKDIEDIIRQRIANPELVKKVWEEAMYPRHAAISLTGEPMMYPYIDEIVSEFHKKGFTTFIVTNGTFPERLSEMNELPTQLYVTLPAPNEKIYKKVCVPYIKNGWNKLNQTLELLESLNCRTVIRITAVKNLNMIEPEEYAKIVEKANPNFLEVKGFTLLGGARLRLTRYAERKGLNTKDIAKVFQPKHKDIMEFASKICEAANFPIIDQFRPSAVALIAVNWSKKSTKIIE